ncbi:MAG: glycosyltransferase family 1 protein [Candidatus Saccharimonadales bacterium]
MRNTKLKLFVDADVLVTPHFSGIGHYTLELLRALDQLLENRNDVTVELGVWFKDVRKLRSYGFRNFKIRRSLIPLRASNWLKNHNLQMPYDLLFGKRVYLFPNYSSWPTWFSKSITVIYDLSFEYFPQYVEPHNQAFLSSQVKKSAARSAKIITISSNSQEEIHEFYGTSLKDIPIIYPGIDQSELFRWPEEAIEQVKVLYGITGKYILFVGNIEPRKNLRGLLLAYERLSKKIRNEYSLLLVGARGWLDNEILEIIERLRNDGNHIQQPNNYVKDADRAALFSGASLFVYPSLYEGFGIPPVEAMACGVPTITSNNSSLPEAVGDAAVTVDANSVKDLTKAITTVLNDPKLQRDMIQKGFTQADKFSWNTEAKKLLSILLEVGK